MKITTTIDIPEETVLEAKYILLAHRNASERRLLSSFYRACLLALVNQCADGRFGQREVFQAEERVKVATILTASWRKRCSTTPGTSLDGGAVSSACFTAERVIRRSGRHQLGDHRLQMGSERALGRDRPHFHPRSVIEARHALCDRRRLLEAVRGQQQVAADCYLRLCERAVVDAPPTLAGDYAPLAA
jgi:hypothetical protein